MGYGNFFKVTEGKVFLVLSILIANSISPYFSLLRFQYLYEPPESKYHDFSISLALGSRLNIFFSDHWIFAPYFEYTRTYVSRLDGLQGGIYMGYYFKTRVSVEAE